MKQQPNRKAIHSRRAVFKGKADEIRPGDYITHASLDEHEDIVGWWVESVFQVAMFMLLQLRYPAGGEERSAWVRADIIVELEREQE